MTDHKDRTDQGPDRSRRSTPTTSTPSATIADRLRRFFSGEHLAALANRLGWARLRRTPGLGWFVLIAAIALFVQGVGLANLIAVDEGKQDLKSEQQTWQATAGQRQTALDEIAALRQEQFAAKQVLHTTKGMIDAESGRLAETKAALKLTQELRDQAQIEQGAARSDAQRQRELNDSLAAKITDLNARKETIEGTVAQLEGDHSRLAAEVANSRKLLDEHRAEVARAQAHAKELDAQAAVAAEAIRQSREGYLKAQAAFDEATKQHAKAAAERDVAQVAFDTLKKQSTILTSDIDSLTKQQADLRSALATLKKATDDAAAGREAAELELTSLLAKLDKLNKQLAEKQGALAAEETLLQSAQTRHDAIKSRVANLQSELKPLEEQRLVIDAAVNGKKKEVETLQQQIESLRADLKSLLETAPKAVTPPTQAKPEAPAAPSKESLLDDAAKAPATKAD
ncbi:MAG: hypothetical protein WD768_21270 [Phycisphaeraceae bacterium]